MMIYVVKQGDTLSSIARQYNTSEELITANNNLQQERLVEGQAIVILISQTIYTVKSGDSLYSIAQRYNTTVNELWRNNPSLNGRSDIQPGQQIVVAYTDNEKNGTLATNGYAYPNIESDALTTTLPYLSYITPFTYGFNSNGDLVMLDDNRIITEAVSRGTIPVMMLSTLNSNGLFDNSLSRILFTDEEMQNNLLQQILTTMQQKGYKGIDIDFEYIFPEEKNNFVRFVQTMKEHLAPYGYEVWVSLAPKTYAEQPGLLYEAHDYEALGAVADKVLLMTYEWGYTYGPPMAVAPLNKVRDVINYAITVIPSKKIFMGVPNYGYDYSLPFVRGKSTARSISNAQAVQLAYDNNAVIFYDNLSQAPFFRYYENSVEHEVWFEDARSIAAKLALAAEKSLYGIGFWNLMRYFPQNWLVLNSNYNIFNRP